MQIEDKKFRVKVMISCHKDALLSFAEISNDKILESVKQELKDAICRQLWLRISNIQKGKTDLHFMIIMEEE